MDFVKISKTIMSMIQTVLDNAVELLKDKPEEKQRLILEACFGETVYADTFSFLEAVNWVKRHARLLKDGASVLIFKMDDAKFNEMFGKSFKDVVLNDDQYLVLTIMRDGNPDETNSLLVKYENLDSRLQAELADGSFVIEE